MQLQAHYWKSDNSTRRCGWLNECSWRSDDRLLAADREGLIGNDWGPLLEETSGHGYHRAVWWFISYHRSSTIWTVSPTWRCVSRSNEWGVGVLISGGFMYRASLLFLGTMGWLQPPHGPAYCTSAGSNPLWTNYNDPVRLWAIHTSCIEMPHGSYHIPFSIVKYIFP